MEKAYRKIDRNVYMKILILGEGSEKAETNDYISLDMEYRTQDDSLLFRGVRKFRISEDAGTALHHVFNQLREGDSVSLLLDPNYFFNEVLNTKVPKYVKASSYLKMNFMVEELQSESEFRKEKELFLNWARELRKSEQDLIREYIERENMDLETTTSGLYFLKLEEGSGPHVAKGRHITIQYAGKFLNGRYFDSTKEQDDFVDFIFGQEYIVLPGIEEALGKMREGDRALAILPSDLAFGREGSIGGIVPPYTALIYEIKVIRVK